MKNKIYDFYIDSTGYPRIKVKTKKDIDWNKYNSFCEGVKFAFKLMKENPELIKNLLEP